MDKENYGVHKSHCCAIHGCKYGDKDCPVVSGEVFQEYECEECSDAKMYAPTYVVITGSNSVPEEFIGSYGKLGDYTYGGKWTVELKQSTKGLGLFSHTVSAKDFRIDFVY